MTEETIEVEGASLEEALQKAARSLGIERSAVAFRYDREHLASGATTIKIFASKRASDATPLSPDRPPEPRAPREDRPRRDDGPRRDDRRGDRGPPRGGRDRGPRGGRDRDRGPRSGEPRERRPPEKDPERDARLQDRARELARTVLESGQTHAMEDLNSYERHLVHNAVAEIGGLDTQSIGEGNRKTVHIKKKQPS